MQKLLFRNTYTKLSNKHTDDSYQLNIEIKNENNNSRKIKKHIERRRRREVSSGRRPTLGWNPTPGREGKFPQYLSLIYLILIDPTPSSNCRINPCPALDTDTDRAHWVPLSPVGPISLPLPLPSLGSSIAIAAALF